MDSYQVAEAGTEFTQSNDYVYKIMYIFLMVIVGIIIVGFSINWITSSSSNTSDNVLLLNGTIDAQTPVVISQDPSQPKQLLVLPSRNRPGGLEFTWSVWIYIVALESSTLYSNVFFKGVYTSNKCNNVNDLTNGPGVYLLNNSENNSANLYILMDTYTSPGAYINGVCDMSNSIQIPHIPLGEWINICIGCQDRNLDVYINGIIASSTRLVGIPKQNNGDIFVAHNNGFQGNISALQYFPKKLSITEILQVFNKGPIKELIVPTSRMPNRNDYLSFNWYVK
jgi:hypothetical protein